MANCIYHSLGLTKTGQGARIESISRGTNSFIVPGKYHFVVATGAFR